MQPRLLGVAVGLAFAGMATVCPAMAGTIYTDQAAFDAAVASLTSKWSEDFEGFSTGAISGPLSIGGGQAEIFTDGPQQVYEQTSTGNQAYWNVEPPSCAPSCGADGLAPQTIIQGPGTSSLSANALSFNYNMGGVGNNMWVASFVSSAGLVNTFLAETSVSYPNGEGGQDVPLFLGWIGAPGEFLQSVTLAPPTPGILVDNTRAFVAETGTIIGTIIVKKETVDSQGGSLPTSENFDFEISPLDPNETFSLNTETNNPDSSQTFTVPAGAAYTIAETSLPANWSLIDVTCTVDGGDPFQPDITNNSITLPELESGQDAECTFRNRFEEGPPPTPTGSIEVKKVTIGGDGLFKFTVTGQASFSLKNGQDKLFSDLPVGAYTIREANLPKGWELQSVSCNKGGKRTKNGINVSLGDGDAISCTFTNFKNEDEVMENLTRLFVHRRVDNLLTYGPGRSRILRRLQEPKVQPLKGGGPLKLADEEGGDVTTHNQALAPQAYSRSFNNNGISGQQSPALLGREAVDQRNEALGIADGQRSSSVQRSTGVLSSVGSQLVPLINGQNNYRFATSLSEVRAAAAEAEAQAQTKKIENAGLGFTENPYLYPYADLQQGFDVWVEGQFAKYDDSSGGFNRDGDFSVLYFGADYTVTPDILVGALFQVDFTDEDINSSTVRGQADGTGWMAGPYIGLKLTDYLFFDARAAWGTSSNDIWVQDALAGRRSGDFDTDRWLATAALTGNHNFGAWRLSPQIGIDYGNESFDAYRNSLSQLVRGNRSSIGRFTGGAELGYRMQTSGGTIFEPTVSITGLWDFDNDNFSIDGVPVDFDDTRAKFEGGLIVTAPSGWSIRGAGSIDGLGAGDFDAYGGQFWLNVPLN